MTLWRDDRYKGWRSRKLLCIVLKIEDIIDDAIVFVGDEVQFEGKSEGQS
jgi:hypothetical protein